MRACRFYIFIIIVLIYNPLYSQKYLPPEVLSVENGLSSQQVSSLAFDHTGYLWIGTKYGLNRYDGYRFRHFFTASIGHESWGGQTIEAIECDLKGNLWILNNTGINRYDHKTGIITKFPSASFDTIFPDEAILKDVVPSEDGTVWVLTERAVTMLAPGEPAKSFPIPADQLRNGAVPTCLITDASGNAWIGTTGGLLVFNLQQGVFRELMDQSSQGLLSDNHVNCLFIDQEDYLWIGTENGLNRLDPVDYNFTQYYPTGSQAPQPGNDIVDMASAEKDVMILATRNGIVKFEMATQSFVSIYKVSDASLNAVAVDSSGIIWGGTSNGILKIRKSRLSVSNYTAQGTELQLSGNYIVSLGKSNTGSLFIGYTDDNYDIVDLKTKNSRNFKTLSGSNVVNFYPFRQNDFLVLSEHDVEVVSNDQQLRRSLFSLYPFLKRELVEKVTLNCLYYDGLNSIWLGTSEGIQYINFDSARHIARQKLNFNNQEIEIGQVYDIEQDLSGNFWLGTSNGLLFYSPSKGNFSRYTPYDKNLMNTERKEVYTLVPGTPGVIWIGTSSGAFNFNTKNREFNTISDAPEVINSSVKALAVDQLKNVWIGTERGLYYYRYDMNSLMHFDLKEGLLNFTYTAILAGNDDYVFLAGQQGLSIINLANMDPVTYVQKVAITGLHFVEKEPSEGDFSYHVSDTITLPWNRKSIQIDFAILDLARPEHNQ
jgi:ligand-binding sensor domain-containing protein